jgi:peptidoglycan/xylan/chitin deacetylase (PgdA/CDA1 family)
MSKKIIKNIIISIILFICVGIAVVSILIVRNNNDRVYEVGNVKYDATNDINEAMLKLKKEKQESKVLTDVNTLEKVVAITFLGLSDMDTNNKVADIMSLYNKKATFMVPGILAAEDSNFILKLNESGYRIGSNGLSGNKHLEELKKSQVVKEFVRTNKIVESITSESPKILQASSTIYTKELLEASYASGYDYVVNSTNYLSYQSFTSYEQVLDYVKGLDKGSIITIKMNGVLDEMEYFKEIEETVEGKENTDNEIKDEVDLGSNEERLVKLVDWLMKAIDEANYETVYAEELPSYEDKDFLFSFNKLRDENQGKLAKVYTSVRTNYNEVGFTFRGIGDKENLNKILSFLDENNSKATFFVTGNELLENKDSIDKIIGSGHEIGNGGLSGKDVTIMSYDEICFEIYKTDKLLKGKYGITTNLFMPVYAKYNDLVLEAARALDYKVVTYSKNPIVDSETSAAMIMEYFKNDIKKGEFVHFRLDLNDEVLEVVQKTYDIIRQKGYKLFTIKILIESDIEGAYIGDGTNNNTNNNTTGKDDVPNKVDNYIKQLRLKNNGKLAEEVNTIYTTDQALTFTFYGINNKEVLYDVLKKLDSINAKGTFFVTKEELDNNGKEIKKILSKGHEIEICLTTNLGTDYESICKYIITMQNELKKQYGINPTLVRYPYVIDANDEILEAISSTGCTLVWQDLSIANSKVGVDGSFAEVISHIFNAGNISARRGYIIYFRMDYYKDNTLIGKLITNIYENRVKNIAFEDDIKNNGSDYRVITLSELMNSDSVYTYPVKEDEYSSDTGGIGFGYLDGLTEDEKYEYIQDRYIGTPAINNENTLPGFTREELVELDKSGRFTEDKVLFLTFDDWGSDKAINHILYVLKKYDIKANFYVRTNYVDRNPNLLRAIALDGHDVGSHTDEHRPFANTDIFISEDDTTSIYTSLSYDELLLRKKDLSVSYYKLQSIIGDVEVDGSPALTKIFRPPTLAMSKGGMEAIFDMGFDYIVSGDFSTHDYEAKDKYELADKIINGIVKTDGSVYTLQNGSVLVMHMSDDTTTPSSEADLTAAALDMVIPILLKNGYEFGRISDYLK